MATQQWSFARARKRSLSAMESPDGETIDPTGAASYKLSRSALRERYGASAIDATAPHSAADTMGNVGIETDPGGMLSTEAGWNRWFHKPPPRPSPTAPMPSVATLAPSSQMNPADLAPFAESPSLFRNPTAFGSLDYKAPAPTVMTNGNARPFPRTPVEYADYAQRSAERWFYLQGLPIPKAGPARPRQNGDNFTSRYGTGKFSFSYEPKLRALGLADEGDDWGF